MRVEAVIIGVIIGVVALKIFNDTLAGRWADWLDAHDAQIVRIGRRLLWREGRK